MAKTVVLRAENAADVTRAAEMLRAGKLVAFATETVYGLGANALSAEAVAGIFAAKERPGWDPLIVHVASAEEVGQVAVVEGELQERVEKLAQAFWPGPLTLLLPKAAAIPASVTAGRLLVGVRVPAHPAALALLREAGVPVAAPSANRFGHTSPTTAEHVLADLGGRIDAVLDAGPTVVGVESTVLDATQMPMVLYRPGAVTAEQLRAASGVPVEVFVPTKEERAPESLPSPGVGIRHYAPRAKVMLVPSTDLITLARAGGRQQQLGSTIAFLLPSGWPSPLSGAFVFDWGDWGDPAELARNLFAGLRELDATGAETIVVPLPPPGALYDAIRDRLMKAARE
jgi:L-threonylcarbamoyladenylate synthase